MDTITHGIVGALTGKALFAGRDTPAHVGGGALSSTSAPAQSSPTANVAIVACTLGSIFPDIDIFAGPLARNPFAIMEWHRNISHSLVLLPVWAALLTVISIPLARWLGWQAPRWPMLFAIFAAGIATHIFLDVVTNFGTMVWSPLAYTRVAWDWLFILDLTLSSLALVPQLAAWCYREPGRFAARATAMWACLSLGALGAYELAKVAGYGFPIFIAMLVSALCAAVLFLPAIRGAGFNWTRAGWCRVGFALVCVYLICASQMHRKALAEVNDFVATQHLSTENIAALPLPPALTHWAGMVATPEGVWRTTFHEPGGAIERTQFYPSAGSNRYIDAAKRLHEVRVYLWFARFPVWQVSESGGQTIVDISDVRFFREGDPPAASQGQQPLKIPGIRTNPAGFTFEIVFRGDGSIVASGFKKPE